MFAVKQYDLGTKTECVGYYMDAFSKNQEKIEEGKFAEEGSDWNKQIGSDKFTYEVSQEQKDRDNLDRSIRRAKTKIRRSAEKYDLSYMWTLTFAKKDTVIYNEKNKKTYHYDASDWEQAWSLFERFIDRCRRNGLKFNYIVTAEIQEKRAEKFGEKLFHFHMVTDQYIPQNEVMRKKYNMTTKGKKFSHSLNDFWTFGFTKASERTSSGKLVLYMIKYISKAFEEIEVSKHKQRYRISNGLEVDFELIRFNDHVEYLIWVNGQKVEKDFYGNDLNKAIVLDNNLEIWWTKLLKF